MSHSDEFFMCSLEREVGAREEFFVQGLKDGQWVDLFGRSYGSIGEAQAAIVYSAPPSDLELRIIAESYPRKVVKLWP